MGKLSVRFVILLVILTVASFLVQSLSYETFSNPEEAVAAIRKIPLTLGKWTGQELPLEDRVYDILETRSIVNRRYRSPDGSNVILSIVYYADAKVDLHSPEECLAAVGTTISKSSRTISILTSAGKKDFDVNQLSWEDAQETYLGYYFYKTGGFLGENYIKFRLMLAANALSSGKTSAALVRVSTPMAINTEKKSSEVLTAFIQELYPALIQFL